ncbi:MAG: HAMP domain-containing histidine kinase [bacterium]|nr:HAMP domain-containing histidine kinase [bacterium]
MRSVIHKGYNLLVSQSLAHTRGKLRLVGILGAVLYPGYYVIWEFIVPLPYENLLLRLAAAAAAAPLIWEARLRLYPAFLGVYWIVATAFCLPFFFTFMMLRNDYNVFWVGSLMAAVVVLILFFPNFRVAFLVWLLGTAAAYLTELAIVGALPEIELLSTTQPLSQGQQLAAFGFVMIFLVAVTNLLNLHRRSVERSGIENINTWAATILHQTLTPISAVNLALQGIRPHVEDRPRLLAIVDSAIAEGHQAVKSAREILSFAVPPEETLEPRSVISARSAIQRAIDTYPYGISGAFERIDLIQLHAGDDFDIEAPLEPFVHVIRNLINNAMNAIGEAQQGHIQIRLERGRRQNTISFCDDACGIPTEDLPFVFESYFTGRPAGLGLGLAYCKQFMHRAGGRIAVRARKGPRPFTEFLLHFPAAQIQPGAATAAR